KFDLQPSSGRKFLTQTFDRSGQSEVVQLGGMEPVGNLVNIRGNLLGRDLQALKTTIQVCGLLCFSQLLQLDRQNSHSLIQIIVQLSSDASPFLFLSID